MFSGKVPLAGCVQPTATISEHFRTVFVVEQVVRFISTPLGVGEWSFVVPTRKLSVGVSAKSDPDRVVSGKLRSHASNEVMLTSTVNSDQISAMLLAASFCSAPEMFVVICSVAGAAMFGPA